MIKANQYGLYFKITSINNQKKPVVTCGKDNQGFSINSELATFLNDIGPNYTQEIIAEINSIDFSLYTIDMFVHQIPSYFDQEDVELFSIPKRASFNDTMGGYIDIPLQDFLDILQEWKSFLLSLSFDYYYSDK